ncbi:MAG: MBL fold metallo-hydrolase [Deltaproteobacteria bacterium HGW-Deltaproteobacteria-6]|jgi:glyoxylase-like metal-dependent hydrolase (beta-lactamase superfamily II)|nr:MAG: MBL fold metallo-hydrolase [Deltaproteobacteria bacterium HGW-Deltaproteobacteria-6]
MQDCQFGRVRFVCGENGGRYPFSHSLYLQGDKTKVVLDPACSLSKLTRLKDEGVDCVWLSHWHEDHIRYLNIFETCPLWLSERDFPPLTDLNVFLDWYDIQETGARAYWEKEMRETFNYRPKEKARFIADDEIIDLGGLSVQVLATPGHTPGHLSFFFPDEELLFLGDYDLTSFGPWYGDLYSSIDETIQSIRRLKAVPAKLWVAAHNAGLYRENPAGLWDNYENVIYQREERILDYLDEPKTLTEILSAWLIYGRPREPKEFYEFNEKVLVGKHLEYMARQGMIVLEKDRYVKVRPEI